MALVSNSKYGSAVELAAASAPSTDVALYAKAAGSGDNAHMVLQAHTASFTGDVHVSGTLNVEGTINSVNRNETNLIVDDKTITVASGSNAEGDVDGAGLNFGGTGDSAFASLLFQDDDLGGSSHHLLSSTAFKATGEIHGTTISGSGPIKTADAIESVGNMRSEGNVTAEGNLAAVAGNLTVGSYGLTNAGALTIASMAGNWTNAGRTVADMGTVTTMVLNGGTADGVTIGGTTPAAGTFDTLVANGNVDLGNATSDTITATGRFDSDLVPSTDSARNLGASDRQWAEAHIDNGQIDALTVTGTSALATVTATTISASSTLVAVGAATFESGLTVNEGMIMAHGNIISLGVMSASAVQATNMAVGGGGTQNGLSVTGSFSVFNEDYDYLAVDYDAGEDVLIFNGTTKFNHHVDLGDGTSDTITATGRFDSDLVPSTDSTRALGTSALQWSAAHIDVGHIDQLGSALDANSQAITNINVDSGDISGADVTVGSGKTLNVSAGTLTTSNAQAVALLKAGAGNMDADLDFQGNNITAATLTADTMTNGRVAIYGTGGVLSEDSDLTFSGDTLTATKIGAFEAAGAINFSDEEMTNVNIDGGAIDGTIIGANTQAAISATTLSASSNLSVGGTAYVVGATTLNGAVTLGDDSDDTITINGTVGNFTAGTITATELVATSDARLKSNIQGVTNAMDVINNLQGVEYDLNETGEHSMGVLAQELIEVAPALVKTRANGNYAVNYSGLSAFFVEAIKEQQAQIEDLKNTVKELSK